MDAQVIIYKRIEFYNKELEEINMMVNGTEKELRGYINEKISNELHNLLLEFQE